MSNEERLYHRAKWVVAEPGVVFENGFVKVEGGKIVEVGTGRVPKGQKPFDYGAGAIMPGVVNTHAHLELCRLKNLVSWENGYRDWLVRLLEERMKLDRATVQKSEKKALQEMALSGVAAVGSVSTTAFDRELLQDSGLSGVWFREYIGNLNGADASQIDSLIADIEEGKNFGRSVVHSMAIHAAHTTAPELVSKVFAAARRKNLLVSMHVAESEDEVEFVTTGKGPWADFLAFRGIRFSHWEIPAKSPVMYLEKLGVIGPNMLAVHLLHIDKKDAEILAKRGVKTCLCPRSNRNLHRRIPKLDLILEFGLKPCLGTDSLASCDSLDVFDEMAFLTRKCPSVHPADILAMGTANGAAALGLHDRLGSLAPGKRAAMVYAPVDASSAENVLESIVNGSFIGPPEKIAVAS